MKPMTSPHAAYDVGHDALPVDARKRSSFGSMAPSLPEAPDLEQADGPLHAARPGAGLERMIDPRRALEHVLEEVEALDGTSVPLEEAHGHVLAEDIHADRDQPPFDRAMMDGLAVCAGDAGRQVRIVGEIAAGDPREDGPRVRPGTAVSIMTGAPCPPGADTVVPKEQIEVEHGAALLPAAVLPGKHIANRGTECRSGEKVLARGDRISPLASAVLASFGVTRIRVHARPLVEVFVTGDEIVTPEETPTGRQIRDSNGPLLASMLAGIGISDIWVEHIRDRLPDLRRAAEAAAAGPAQVLVFTGGVSAGDYDHVPQALQEAGAQLVFHKVAQKPGKPLLFARFPDKLAFGLPGNPLSCHLNFHRYIAPALRRMMGQPVHPRGGRGRLRRALDAPQGKTRFALVRVHPAEDGTVELEPLRPHGSADIYGAVHAEAFVQVAPGSVCEAGAMLPFEWIEGRT